MTTLTLRTMAVSVGALIAATAFGAHAADIYGGPGGFKDGPYVPVNTWTGFYVGGNVGGAWSGNSGTITFLDPLSADPFEHQCGSGSLSL